ncbi:MAG: protein disulfide isomerase family protein [Campylobacterota bacterium]|nr:protein disulfide isomerase family protein [Campylobacterota bacterium]
MQTILELTDSNYTSFIEESSSAIFIDFYSPTCGPCQTLMAYLPRIADNYKDDNVVIAKVDVSINPKLAKKFMVQSVPLIVIIGDDKMVKSAEVGLARINKYFNMIDKELGKNRGFFSKLFG